VRSSPIAALLLALAAAAAADEAPPPTYYGDVLAIFQERCQVCHREGEIGPFPLDSYREAAGWSAMIGEVVEDRRMPPWHADRSVGEFENERGLADEERAAILAWVDAGAPPGDPDDAPPPVEWPEHGWRIGEPDAVLSMPRELEVPASGVVDYQYVDVPTDFGEDKWVKAIQIRPGARDVVHHVLVFTIYPDGSHRRVHGGLRGYFGAYLPGEDIRPFPAGSAKLLPRGTTLRFQLHYTPNGEAAVDRTEIGLVFADEDDEIERRAATVSLFSTRFRIPAGAEEHTVRARHRFRQDVLLVALTPHMHLRGDSFRYLLMYPDGAHREVLRVPQYDFNWQTSYRLSEPLFVPRGSTMLGVATFDNSAANPANPDPTVAVRFGEQTWDEMMIGYMDILEASAEDRAAWEASER